MQHSFLLLTNQKSIVIYDPSSYDPLLLPPNLEDCIISSDNNVLKCYYVVTFSGICLASNSLR